MDAIFTVLAFTMPPLILFGWLTHWFWKKSQQPERTGTSKIFLGIMMTCCGLIALAASLCGAMMLSNS